MTFLLFIGEAYRFGIKHWRAFVIGATVLALFIGIAMLKGCWTDHEINKAADEINQTKTDEANKDAVTKVADAEVKDTKKNAQGAANASKRANENVNAARANVSNVPLTESERWRCQAYPADCGK